MNEPAILIGVAIWLFLVVCFVVGFGSMVKDPRKAWERGYHRQGILLLFGSWPEREGASGEPTEQDLAEVRRRSILGLVIGLFLSPAIVAVAFVVGQARFEAQSGGGMGRTWGNLYKVEVGMTIQEAEQIMGSPGSRMTTQFGEELVSWNFVDADDRHWLLCIEVEDGKVAKKYKTESGTVGQASGGVP